jgi:hypothetical protein
MMAFGGFAGRRLWFFRVLVVDRIRLSEHRKASQCQQSQH